MRAQKLGTDIRQEQIAETALDLVADQGMKALSVARVAHRIGVVPSAIYRHYRSKDEVLEAVLNLIQDKLTKNIEIVCNDYTDALERLHHLLQLHIKLIRENQGIPRIVLSQEIHRGHPQRKIRMNTIIEKYLAQVTDIICQGQTKGHICSEFAPETISMMYLGIIQPAAFRWELSDGQFDITKHADKAWRILEASIRNTRAPGHRNGNKQMKRKD
jgi:AcrR family transcriptional regulator